MSLEVLAHGAESKRDAATVASAPAIDYLGIVAR